MNLGPESMVVLTCSLFTGNVKQMETWRIKDFFCLRQLFFRAVMSLPVSWSHKMPEVINEQQFGYRSFKDTGII